MDGQAAVAVVVYFGNAAGRKEGVMPCAALVKGKKPTPSLRSEGVEKQSFRLKASRVNPPGVPLGTTAS